VDRSVAVDVGGWDVRRSATGDDAQLRPYVAELLVHWLTDTPTARHRAVEGTLAFVDISGFTRLTERLAANGKAGAEEMSGLLDATFAELLDVAYAYGASLVKWGGDAVLLLFTDDGHAARACTAAYDMNRLMRRVGRLRTSVGPVTLRMSVGVHSGRFDFFLAGSRHHELVVAGPGATVTATMEGIAEAGEIGLSPATAALLDAGLLGPEKGEAILLARSPHAAPAFDPRGRGPAAVDLGRCLPAVTREHLATGVLDGEHRQVAVGFVEFSGIDAVLERQGPGAAAAAVDHVITTCQESAERHLVTFWETDIGKDGGKVMLVAGAPTSAGADEDRMLAVAREVADAGGALSVRVGVNCGRVFSGGFGPAYRRTYSVKGDAVNLAARLMAKASSGEVLASADVLDRARTAYTTEPLEPFLVKGKVRPVHASRVGRAIGMRVGTASAQVPLAGREPELGVLVAALEDARHGRGRVVDLVGEPGIGKSRLVEELRVRAVDVTVVSAVCDEYHSSTPYAPFRQLLRELLGIDDDAEPKEAGAALLSVVQHDAPELEAWTPLLGAIVEADVPATAQTSAVDERFRRAQQERAACDLLARLLPGPSAVIVEDTHLSDEASRDLLERLAENAPTLPWLLVVTRRPGPRGLAVAEAPHARRVELAPLDESAVASVLRGSADDSALPAHELASLASRAGGNPLFLLELLDAARAAGSTAGLPDSVEGLISAQVDRLPPAQRRVLRAASVLGVRVDPKLLAATMAADGQRLPASALQELGDFLEPGETGQLRFRHTLVRDTAYEGLPYARRRTLHGLAADVIRSRAGARADDVADLLSLHFFNAGRYADAWAHSRTAGRRAQSVYAYAEAAEFYDRALACAQQLALPEPEVALVAEALGDARYRLGEFARAATAYGRARKGLAGHGLDHVRLHHKTALVADRTGAYTQALRWLSRGRRLHDLVPPSADSGRLRAEMSVEYATVRHWQGRQLDAIRWCRRAIEEAERVDAPDVMADALVWLDVCELTLGRPGDGAQAKRALEIWHRLGDRPWNEGRTLNELGIRAYFAGSWDDARRYYSQAKRAFERAGDLWTASVASGNEAEILSDQGRLQEAEPLLRDALRLWRASGAPSFVAFGSSQLGRLSARNGRYADGLTLLQAARDQYTADGEQVEIFETDARIAECHLLAGDGRRALDLADATLVRAAAMPGVAAQLPLLHRVRGLALGLLGDAPAAFAALDDSLATARRRDAQHEVAWTLHAQCTLASALGAPLPSSLATERDRLFAALGVVAVADPPFTTLKPTVVRLPEPRSGSRGPATRPRAR
jgi:class 3 adenylate cyclase/tetratricopeptide (TPR) repeat protein